MSSTLGQDASRFINSGFPSLWIHSNEQEYGVEDLRREIYGDDFPIFVRWDGAEGLKIWTVEAQSDTKSAEGWAAVENTEDFSDALRMIQALGMERMTADGPTRVCAVFLNVQLHINTPTRAQELLNYLHKAETVLRQRFLVLSTVPIPSPEILIPSFTRLEHTLPDREQLREVLGEVATEDGDLPDDEGDVEAILDAARGMTRSEAKNAFSLSLNDSLADEQRAAIDDKFDPGWTPEEGRIRFMPVFEHKARELEGNDLGLSIRRTREKIDDVVGHEHIKMVYRELMENMEECRGNPDMTSPGIIVAGISGGGKSMILSALGASVSPSRPTIQWKQALAGSEYVSKGARKTDEVTRRLEGYAPTNVLIDEGGKSMSANVKGGEGSAVQAAEQSSIWLDWHETTDADVFIMVSMNEEFDALFDRMPEYRNRFEASFFVDYPTPEQLDQIWIYQLKRFNVIEHPDQYWDMKQRNDIPECKWWVGRNVRNCAKAARRRGRRPCEIIMDIPESMPDTAKRMREAAAKHGLLSSEYEGIYDPAKHEKEMRKLLADKPSQRDSVRRPPKKKVLKKKVAS